MWLCLLFASPVVFPFAGQTALSLGFEGFMNLNAWGGSSQHCIATVLTCYPACFASKGVLACTSPAAHSVLRPGGICFFMEACFSPGRPYEHQVYYWNIFIPPCPFGIPQEFPSAYTEAHALSWPAPSNQCPGACGKASRHRNGYATFCEGAQAGDFLQGNNS